MQSIRKPFFDSIGNENLRPSIAVYKGLNFVLIRQFFCCCFVVSQSFPTVFACTWFRIEFTNGKHFSKIAAAPPWQPLGFGARSCLAFMHKLTLNSFLFIQSNMESAWLHSWRLRATRCFLKAWCRSLRMHIPRTRHRERPSFSQQPKVRLIIILTIENMKTHVPFALWKSMTGSSTNGTMSLCKRRVASNVLTLDLSFY